MRTGFGVDVHALDGEPPLVLCGVEVSAAFGLSGTSDADAAAHSVADALLGAAVLGDIGTHFPSSDAAMEGADSMQLLRSIVAMVGEAGFSIEHVDLTVVAESVRIAPYRDLMRQQLADVLGITVDAVSVKATSTDRLGLVGRGEGIAAIAVATLA